MPVEAADGVIIGAIGGTIVLTTVQRVTSDADSRGPTMVVVIGGVLVTVPLLILADYEPKLAVAFALLILLGKVFTSTDVLGMIGNVLKLKPGQIPVGSQVITTGGGSTQAVLKSSMTSTVPVPSGTIGTVISYALNQQGLPYSENPDGTHSFDCSLLVQKAYAAAGIPIGRTTFEQVKQGVAVNYKNLQPGDLIFEKGLNPQGQWVDLGHVVMYLGNNLVIQAPHTGANVSITPLPSETSVQAIRRYTNG